MAGSDYDGQDQAYQDLLEENERLVASIQDICELIWSQQPLRYQDGWLENMIKRGVWSAPEEDE